MVLTAASAAPGRAPMKTKTIILLVAVGLFIILLIQNSGSVPFRIFFWRIDMSTVILAPLIFFLGFIAGYWRAHFGRRRDRGRVTNVPPPSPPQPPQIASR
jgi:uncharacterized integral membrane protein